METSTINKQQILSKYMEYILDHGEKPKSIYAFTKQLNIEEQLFYNYYSSFDELAQDVYTTFYNETIKLITKDKSFDELDPKNKLLLFYFTFFELLTANRSYVLLTLKESKNVLEKIKNLQSLKANFKNFIKGLDLEKIDFKQNNINQLNEKSIEEMAWNQLLFTLKFWIEDRSPSFEKTDIFIEKSVNASFDLLDITPIKNIIDFGKFFFKEKIKPNL